MANLGENVQAEVKGSGLTITINLTHKGGRTPKGYVRVASTLGNKSVPGAEGLKLGLNAYTEA